MFLSRTAATALKVNALSAVKVSEETSIGLLYSCYWCFLSGIYSQLNGVRAITTASPSLTQAFSAQKNANVRDR